MFFKSLFVLLYFVFWPLCCLFFFGFWLPIWYFQTLLTLLKRQRQVVSTSNEDFVMSGRLRTFAVDIISIIFTCTIKGSFIVPHQPNFYICYRHTSTCRSAIIIIIPYHTGIKHSTMICEQSVIHIFDYLAYCKYQDLLFIWLYFLERLLIHRSNFLKK